MIGTISLSCLDIIAKQFYIVAIFELPSHGLTPDAVVLRHAYSHLMLKYISNFESKWFFSPLFIINSG
jgi:hypothetical protein